MGVDAAERHQLDDCAKANIWDSSADHQTMSLAAVARREGKLVSKRHSLAFRGVQMRSEAFRCVQRRSDAFTWAGRFSQALCHFSFLSLPQREGGKKKKQPEVPLLVVATYACTPSQSGGSVRADSEREGKKGEGGEQFVLADALPFSPAGPVV